MTTHTPTPWGYRAGHDPHNQGQIYDGDGKTLAVTYQDDGGTNAALIVRAVNSHAELVAAVESLLQFAVAWRYEYADKPQDAHNNAQRDRIDAAVNGARAALAAAKE